MKKIDIIKEVANCLEKPNMRHFFDKNKKFVILSLANEEIVDFIIPELKRIEKDNLNYLEFNALSQEELNSIMQEFSKNLKNKQLISELTTLVNNGCPLHKFTKELAKHPKIQMNWINFKDEKLDAKAEGWLNKHGLL